MPLDALVNLEDVAQSAVRYLPRSRQIADDVVPVFCLGVEAYQVVIQRAGVHDLVQRTRSVGSPVVGSRVSVQRRSAAHNYVRRRRGGSLGRGRDRLCLPGCHRCSGGFEYDPAGRSWSSFRLGRCGRCHTFRAGGCRSRGFRGPAARHSEQEDEHQRCQE